MKDLKISCINAQGRHLEYEYDTIMQFTDIVESNNKAVKSGGALNENVPPLDACNLFAEFFENFFNVKHFADVTELYNHCKMIMS